MAKDDYFVIVLYILSYLYKCLKSGSTVDKEILLLQRYPENIEESYIMYIYDNLYKGRYIDGVVIKKRSMIGTNKIQIVVSNLKNTCITPKGIEYLQENSVLNKIKDTVKDIKDMIPFI